MFANVLNSDRFGHSGSGSNGFYDLKYDFIGYHIDNTESFSNRIYMNTWNHMMSTIDTNSDMSKNSPPYSVQ